MVASIGTKFGRFELHILMNDANDIMYIKERNFFLKILSCGKKGVDFGHFYNVSSFWVL